MLFYLLSLARPTPPSSVRLYSTDTHSSHSSLAHARAARVCKCAPSVRNFARSPASAKQAQARAYVHAIAHCTFILRACHTSHTSTRGGAPYTHTQVKAQVLSALWLCGAAVRICVNALKPVGRMERVWSVVVDALVYTFYLVDIWMWHRYIARVVLRAICVHYGCLFARCDWFVLLNTLA